MPPAVHAYCRARLAGGADGADRGESAADLVSVVFLEAWRRCEVILEGDSALLWLLGVARRVLLHQARSIRRHRAALSRLEPGAASVARGVPIGTVRSRLSRARSRLSALMEES